MKGTEKALGRQGCRAVLGGSFDFKDTTIVIANEYSLIEYLQTGAYSLSLPNNVKLCKRKDEQLIILAILAATMPLGGEKYLLRLYYLQNALLQDSELLE